MSVARNRSLVILGVAESVSGIGSWITMMAVLALVVFRGQGGVAESSAIFLAGLLPTLLSSPLAGWLCDRYDRKRLMIASELLDGLVVASLIFARRLEIIYGLVALQAVVMSIMQPARQSVIPDLVGPDELTRANALLQQLAAFVKIGAPVLAGLVLAVIDPHTAIVLDVVSYGLSAAILSRLPALPPHRQRRAAGAEPARTAEVDHAAPEQGPLDALRRSPHLQLLFAAMFLGIAIVVSFDVLSSIMTRDVLRGEEGLYGLLIGLIGAGSAVSAAVLLARGQQRDPWRDVTMGMALLAALPAACALATVVAGRGAPETARLVLGAGSLLGGLGNGLTSVQVGTLLQRLSPASLLGRIGGLFQSTAVAGQLVGIVATPIVVPGLLPLGPYFGLATAALLALVLGTLLLLRRAPRAGEATC